MKLYEGKSVVKILNVTGVIFIARYKISRIKLTVVKNVFKVLILIDIQGERERE